MRAALALLILAILPAHAQRWASKEPKATAGQPAPRTPDGKVDFSGVYHAPGYGPGDPKSKTNEGFAHNIARDLNPADVPMLPWAAKVYKERFENESKDDPEGLCLPMGTPRVNPYPWRIVQTDKLLVILYEGNVHTYRQVFLDGRPHDKTVKDTWWGDSIGHWEGDTLVVETVGLNDKAWLDADGHPRTKQARIIERFTRVLRWAKLWWTLRLTIRALTQSLGRSPRSPNTLPAGKSWNTSVMRTRMKTAIIWT